VSLAERERNAALEQELENAQDIRDLASQMAEAFQGGGVDNGRESGVGQTKVDEPIEERNELRSKLENSQSRVDTLETKLEALEAAQQRLEALEAINLDEATEAVTRLQDALGIEAGEDVAKWRRKAKQERERRKAAEADAQPVVAPDEYDEFVDDEYVREAIEQAKDDATPRYVKGVVAAILQRGGPVSRQTVADDLGIQSPHHIGKAMKELDKRGVVTRSGSGTDEEADFAFKRLKEIHERQARQRRTEEAMEGL